MAVGGMGADVARNRLVADMVFREDAPREPMDDVERAPRPGPRPTDRAQWDEVHACWIEWDDDDHLWVHVERPARRADSAGTDTG